MILERMKGKKIGVLGFGVSNRPLVDILLSVGADITVCDKAEDIENKGKYEALGVKFILGKEYLDHLDFDVIFRSPGILPTKGELVQAAARGVQITSEMNEFMKACPSKIIAVTGSDGKTTTTSIIYEFLKDKYRAFIGGNIGTPLLNRINEMTKEDIVILELSSFQLMDMEKSPNIGVLTNVTPNHLDKHTDMTEYIQAKKQIFKYQDESDFCVFNADNEVTFELSNHAKNARLFSRKNKVENGAYYDGNTIYMKGQPVLDRSDILLLGDHNVENYMAAICAVWELVDIETIQRVAREFTGVKHRMQLIRELDGVRYYDDSIATSPARTIAGLLAMPKKPIIILGGYDKEIPFDTLGEAVAEHVKAVVLLGATSGKIRQAILQHTDTIELKQTYTMEEAVRTARGMAESGDIITLSPACAAFDLYTNFMVRGEDYIKIVGELK